jgi:hypothetical protein
MRVIAVHKQDSPNNPNNPNKVARLVGERDARVQAGRDKEAAAQAREAVFLHTLCLCAKLSGTHTHMACVYIH